MTLPVLGLTQNPAGLCLQWMQNWMVRGSNRSPDAIIVMLRCCGRGPAGPVDQRGAAKAGTPQATSYGRRVS